MAIRHYLLPLLAALILSLAGCDSYDNGEYTPPEDETDPPNNQVEPFTVTVDSKTSQHPYDAQGWGEGFVIDGVQGKELTLERGVTYTFQLEGVSSIHSFYISTSSAGAGAGVYSDGVSGNFANGNDELTFTPGADTPDLLYYQCNTSMHQYMGWKINVTGTADGGQSSGGNDDGNGNNGGNDDPYDPY